MASLPQVIAQLAPGSGSLEILYDCPAQTMAEIAAVLVCNRSTATTFRIAVSVGGAVIANAHYLYYDLPIAANDTFVASIGLTLRAGDILRVYAGSANLSFNLLGDVTYPVANA